MLMMMRFSSPRTRAPRSSALVEVHGHSVRHWPNGTWAPGPNGARCDRALLPAFVRCRGVASP